MGAIYKNGVAYSGDTPEMTGATSSAAGKSGLVPTPGAGDQEKFLKADGTWSIPEGKYLVQSGTATTGAASSGGIISVTFPTKFKTVPEVTATAHTAGIICSISQLYSTNVVIQTYSANDASLTSATFDWIAIGEGY